MSRRTARSIIALLALALLSCTKPVHADGLGGETFRVKLFGCELPIPNSYALNGRELDRIVLSRDSGDVGRIVISKFAGYSENYEISDERKVGRLMVAELVNHEQWQSPDYDMSIIRDDAYILALMGSARELKDSLVEACLSPATDAEIQKRE
jgi:hypothetical protein